MNFNANISNNLKLMLASILGSHLFVASVSAELVQSPDRLEELSKSLAQGAYNLDDLELPASARMNVKLKESDNSEKFTMVYPEDYPRLKIRPLYEDSVIKYGDKSKNYFEVRRFQNNIVMIYNIDKEILTVLDQDEDKPSEESWNVGCSKDKITDAKNCVLYKYEFTVLRSSKEGLILTVTKELDSLNFREFNYIRIDKNPAYKNRGIFKGQSALNIISEMKIGRIANTRFYEWDGKKYEETIPLWGFSVAYDVMNKMYARVK